MTIWVEDVTLDHMNQRSRNTLAEHLAIEFIEIGNDYIKARMPVDHRTKQPLGLLNGGASCALAETAASTAANYCVDQTQKYCVGLAVDANHIRPATEGFVVATAKAVHLGKTTQVWDVTISNNADKIVCLCRMTMAVVSR